MTPSGSRPLAPSGRGSMALKPNQSAIPLKITMAIQNIANSVIGWGNKLPKNSTVAKKRLNKPCGFCSVDC